LTFIKFKEVFGWNYCLNFNKKDWVYRKDTEVEKYCLIWAKGKQISLVVSRVFQFFEFHKYSTKGKPIEIGTLLLSKVSRKLNVNARFKISYELLIWQGKWNDGEQDVRANVETEPKQTPSISRGRTRIRRSRRSSRRFVHAF